MQKNMENWDIKISGEFSTYIASDENYEFGLTMNSRNFFLREFFIEFFSVDE